MTPSSTTLVHIHFSHIRQLSTPFISLYLSLLAYTSSNKLLMNYIQATNNATPPTHTPHHNPLGHIVQRITQKVLIF